MKKLLIAMIMVVMCLAFAGCGDSSSGEEPAEPETTAATEAEQSAEPEYVEYSFVKEITSDTGFDMDVMSVGLTPEGDVIMRTQGDLAASLGEQVKVATGVKDIYVEPFGNGGYYSILMIRQDRTVSAVNTSKLIGEKETEILNNLGGYQDVSAIESVIDFDAFTINAVLANGDKYMLDPYLK